ncbi:hypothetical protein [Demequina sp. NBRC 110056]|uniref:hypothetical protein n=1 Tax=Demequina sp. NBRC 110056 TaxID=1570345 RepID=UPI000A06E338|nr:hypothetical protein [Demequina sp. NBRC 110056]
MRALRVITSAFLVLLGSMMMVVWALAVNTVASIEDGSAADQLTARVLESPATADLVADQVQRMLEERIEGQVGGIALELLDEEIRELVVSVVGSDLVTGALSAGADRVQNRLFDEVSDPERTPGPFVIAVDLGERVNGRIDEVPVVGPLIPDIDLPEYEVEVIDAATFEDVRTGYSALTFAATWFVWIGLALIVGGIAAAPRWRWFLPRALVGAGALGLAIAFALGAVGPSTLASFMPGGADGGAGVLVEDVVATTALGPIVDVLMVLGIVALGIAALFWLLVRFVPALRDREPSSRGPEVEPEADTLELEEYDGADGEHADTRAP